MISFPFHRELFRGNWGRINFVLFQYCWNRQMNCMSSVQRVNGSNSKNPKTQEDKMRVPWPAGEIVQSAGVCFTGMRTCIPQIPVKKPGTVIHLMGMLGWSRGGLGEDRQISGARWPAKPTLINWDSGEWETLFQKTRRMAAEGRVSVLYTCVCTCTFVCTQKYTNNFLKTFLS